MSGEFRRSSFTRPETDDPVEVDLAASGGLVEVRAGGSPGHSTMLFSHEEWDEFIAGVKTGEFDLPVSDS